MKSDLVLSPGRHKASSSRAAPSAALLALLTLGLVACGDPLENRSLAAAFQLDRMPTDAECVLPGRQLQRITFNIKPGQPVTATIDGRLELPTEWDSGFEPDPYGARSIRDATGAVVVTDGQVIPIPAHDVPRLADHFVCIGDTVWVFDEASP